MLDKAEYASFSRLNLLSVCRQKYNWRYVEKVPPLEPLPDRMRIGSCVDDALDASQHKSYETYEEYLIRKRVEFLDEKWKHFCRGIWEVKDALYKRIFGEEKDEIILQMPIDLYIVNKETGEIICAGKEEDKDMPFIGVLDAYWPETNTIYEIKTTGGAINQTFLEHTFKGQTQIYCTGMMEKHGIKDIPHVTYVYVKKPRIKQKNNKKEQETIEDFHKRMYEAGKLVGTGNKDEIEFREKDYKQEELDETMQYFFDRVQNDLHAVPTKERNSCFTYGERCEFWDYCWKHQNVAKEVIEPEAA